MDFDDENIEPEDPSFGDEPGASSSEEERPERFVTLPVGPDVGLAEVVAAAQQVDQAQAAWHSGVSLSQRADAIGAAAPGASLARVLEAAAERVPADRDQATRIELIAACERQMAQLAGLQAKFAQELLDERGASSRTLTAVHDEISCRLATTSYAAGTIITRASALEDSLRLQKGLDSGEVSARKLDVIAAAVSDLDPSERTVLEDYGCELAPTHTPPQLKKALAAAIIAADPARAEQRHQREVRERHLIFEPAAHGMSWLGVYLPAEDGLNIFTCLDAQATSTSAEDERGIDARRVDALTGLFESIMASGRLPDGASLPTHHGRTPHIRFSVTAPVLAGDDQTPALLHGYGPIGAETARQLARRAGTDAGGLASPALFGTSTTAPAADTCADTARSNAGRSPCEARSGADLATQTAATWAERWALADKLDPGTTAEQRDAIFGPAWPWPDSKAREEDLAIWRALLDRPQHVGQPSAHPGAEDRSAVDDQPGAPPQSGPGARQSGPAALAADSGAEAEQREPRRRSQPCPDPMRSLLPPPRPAELPDGANADELIAWAQRHHPGADGLCSSIEDHLGLLCADSYAPTRRLRARIIERDQTCRFPTCRVPAWRCQLDHIAAFDGTVPAWAQTVETNLQALCTHHHHTKTAGIFRVERDPRTGVTTWYAPTGHIYTRSPEHADYTSVTRQLQHEFQISSDDVALASATAEPDSAARTPSPLPPRSDDADPPF